jgi:hypothetical protein
MGMVPQTREVYEWVGYLNVQPHIRIKKWSSYPRTPLGLPSLRKLWLFALSLPTQVHVCPFATHPFYCGRQIILYHFELFKVISVDTWKQF